MNIDWKSLHTAAIGAMRNAYAPYSKFPVGAAASTTDGRTVVGCNVENISFGLTLCAECSVVSALHTAGGGRLAALVCVDSRGEILMPCGRCRQLLYEHGGPEMRIAVSDGSIPLSELLPRAFGPGDFAAGQQQPG
ncbi:cytidine deaminase [Hoyosella rhizosphaerae]|uniref:cytidine deaminase n=1 Tax=Hoyosella rhizosphaerae TaxID=1755582 RepID=UPI00166F1457|nr:cytidine deaminase [Hoyosella rhizosphaerae]MBN4926068.1 cytidine deaminase [Hoyosella rhizosphaerae]